MAVRTTSSNLINRTMSSLRGFPTYSASRLRPCSLLSQEKLAQSLIPRVFASSAAVQTEPSKDDIRQPRPLQALHLKPLKRQAEFGVPSCDLQLRSFSTQPLEFFADFALRAAYYLGLPAYGPVPLPRLVERWTVPKSHFIFKKAQENFERVTLRRLIQIKDGHPETVQLWLAYLRKHQYYGVGLKANFWEFTQSGLDLEGETGDARMQQLDASWSHLGQKISLGSVSKVEELLNSQRGKQAAGLQRSPAHS